MATFSKWLSKQNILYMKLMTPTSRQRRVALAVNRGRCILCGSNIGVELHHNVRRKWGIHDSWNLWSLCRAHHRQMFHNFKRDGAPFQWPSEQSVVSLEDINAGVTQEIQQSQQEQIDAGVLAPKTKLPVISD